MFPHLCKAPRPWGVGVHCRLLIPPRPDPTPPCGSALNAGQGHRSHTLSSCQSQSSFLWKVRPGQCRAWARLGCSWGKAVGRHGVEQFPGWDLLSWCWASRTEWQFWSLLRMSCLAYLLPMPCQLPEEARTQKRVKVWGNEQIMFSLTQGTH